jgi:hypothetical protein
VTLDRFYLCVPACLRHTAPKLPPAPPSLGERSSCNGDDDFEVRYAIEDGDLFIPWKRGGVRRGEIERHFYDVPCLSVRLREFAIVRSGGGRRRKEKPKENVKQRLVSTTCLSVCLVFVFHKVDWAVYVDIFLIYEKRRKVGPRLWDFPAWASGGGCQSWMGRALRVRA